MVTYNLTHPDSQLIRINRYPDGQQDVTLLDVAARECTIASRLTSWRDLELVVATNQALRCAGVRQIRLNVSYFLGARADRVFQPGMCHYLRDVICPVINDQCFSEVSVLDPHSDVLCGLLKRSRALPADHFVTWVKSLPADTKLLFPDAGAEKRYAPLGFNRESYQARKRRDLATGSILETTILGDVSGQNLLIIDDLCDGGRTFLEHAAVARSQNAGLLSLAVTHGIFSQGLTRLTEVFNQVFTTNSYRDFEPHPQLEVLEVI